MIVNRTARRVGGGLPAAGELLAVEAIDRTGLIVTSEGALVRIFRVTPRNPLLMSAGEREKTAAAFQRLLSQLGADETVQIYIDARPVNLTQLLADCRREVQASAGPVPSVEDGDRLALARWRLYAAMEESLRLHADAQAAVQVSCYVVVPLVPRQTVARAALAWAKRSRLPTASLERPVQAHRRAVREQLAHTDALRSELEAEGMATELLDGEQVLRLLWARLNPTKADHAHRRAPAGVEVLGELEAPADRDLARDAALRLREQIAQSSLDFRASHQHVVVDRDVEQTILIANTAGRTQMGWLHGAMLTRQPFTLSVFVHGLERRRERQKLKLAYRRLHTINRGAEQRGRVPDFDRYVQEREYRELLGEMASGEQAGLYRVAVYQTLRARGPDPDLAALSEAVDFCTESDRVGGGLQGQPWRVSPAPAVVLEPAIGPRPTPQGAQVPDRQRRRHGAADRHEVRLADRGAVRVRRPRPHRRAHEPLRRGARQPHARHQWPERKWEGARHRDSDPHTERLDQDGASSTSATRYTTTRATHAESQACLTSPPDVPALRSSSRTEARSSPTPSIAGSRMTSGHGKPRATAPPRPNGRSTDWAAPRDSGG